VNSSGAPIQTPHLTRGQIFLANQPISALPKNVSPVSVLVDIYKHERFIEKSIISVPEQDFPPLKEKLLLWTTD